MKILLLGEYSGVHYELSRALKKKGHNVTLVSNGDGYKNYPRDIDINPKSPSTKVGKVIAIASDFLGVKGVISCLKYRKIILNLKNYDVVQLINPIFLQSMGSLVNMYFLRKISKSNGDIYLCALGDDYFWVKDNLSKKYKYSALNKLSLSNFYHYIYSLRYVFGMFFKLQHKYTVHLAKGIIPGLEDYRMVYCGKEIDKNIQMIRIPLDEAVIRNANEKLKILENKVNDRNFDEDSVSIFHGWQKGKDLRKGNDILDSVIKRLSSTNKVSYKVVSGVEYSEYIKLFEECDLFLDQVYSYDRGVNAIIGMAAGKVVVSGYESEIVGGDNITSIGVNAVPDEKKMLADIGRLISDSNKIRSIKINALRYVINHHDPNIIADQYLKFWNNNK
ncbi:hypothetical protein M5204_001296 [Vibrio vulnificus]|uniref:hypothetical protein n=1 Tax=Vibrio vulnificus TaxID=672 RepID=UPI00287A489A|nr:hypothetical protein [Vibrio vulnificus]EIY9461353.1 hypothetical protein [Vibrio vulnificus]EJE8668279.1 hypothetical protein [Vibrio vulnificus]MDS1841977.1 hypothetical protein [Vibrio vulnificus]MDS1850486.1 hypothetical protein [Vibrio vulnificus]